VPKPCFRHFAGSLPHGLPGALHNLNYRFAGGAAEVCRQPAFYITASEAGVPVFRFAKSEAMATASVSEILLPL
jgi:hypothetical protein